MEDDINCSMYVWSNFPVVWNSFVPTNETDQSLVVILIVTPVTVLVSTSVIGASYVLFVWRSFISLSSL